MQARHTFNSDVKPIFVKARPVAFVLKTKVDEEIENLVNQGVLRKVICLTALRLLAKW